MQTTRILMTPGPAEVYTEILATIARSQLVHYGTEWVTSTGKFAVHSEPSSALFKPNLQSGSRSMVIEMDVAKALNPGAEVVNVVAGYFHRRWSSILMTLAKPTLS